MGVWEFGEYDFSGFGRTAQGLQLHTVNTCLCSGPEIHPSPTVGEGAPELPCKEVSHTHQPFTSHD